MTKKWDGGPAFPIVGTTEDVKVTVGMSLRDYFAGIAMQGMWACPRPVLDDKGSTPKNLTDRFIAKCAYEQADAMLKERAK